MARPSLATCTSLLSKFGKSRHWQHAWATLAEMRHWRLQLDAVACSAAISACDADGRHWRCSLALLEELLHTPKHGQGVDSRPTVVVFGAAAAALERGGQWRLASEGIFRVMQSRAVFPDKMTFHAAVRACAKAKEWQHACFLLAEDMRIARLSPHRIAVNAVISSCRHEHLWERALSIWVDLQKSLGIEPDTDTYNSLIAACGASHRWQEACKLLQVQRQRRFQPSIEGLGACMEALSGASLWQAVLDLKKDIEFETQNMLDVTGYGTALKSCERAYRWREALALLAEMNKSRQALQSGGRLAADEACISSLIAALEGASQPVFVKTSTCKPLFKQVLNFEGASTQEAHLHYGIDSCKVRNHLTSRGFTMIS
eukprot:TRINITY_DN16877_c0_g1_i1.p1 TRINITY_DN16877_c0_g1~~TRINITY_DN16877_c0_g1_i1.p1  ORF type:complete len:373 (-),score=68.38 TRINITY_DN16877_c0_g1_i1:150-1268(-)